MISLNPKNGIKIKEYEAFESERIRDSLDRAERQFQEWKATDVGFKAKYLFKLESELKKQKADLARIITDEMGKPIKEGEAEVEKCAWLCKYYAENLKEFLSPQVIETDFARSEVHFLPQGGVLGIMPWNYPFWQVMRFAVPTIAGGNVALLKHASNVTGCGLIIEDLFRLAGFPEGIFTTLVLEKEKLEEVIRSDFVIGIAFTGSDEAGSKVAEMAGRYLKKTVCELGGSDATLVLDDANIDRAVERSLQSRLLNAGQSCISTKRFIVDEKVYETFREKILEKCRQMKVGDPLEPDTDIGPLAKLEFREKLNDQIESSVEEGAKCLLGGEKPLGKGAFYPVTVLENVTQGVRVFDEETFGPVIALSKVSSTAEAIELANNSRYGLAASIYCGNEEHGRELGKKYLEVGTCFVNDYVRSDPRLPFGGCKKSGFGRELSELGMKEFLNVKTVCIGQ